MENILTFRRVHHILIADLNEITLSFNAPYFIVHLLYETIRSDCKFNQSLQRAGTNIEFGGDSEKKRKCSIHLNATLYL